MKILLLNIDQRFPNLALEKIALWHKDDEVIWDMPIMASQCDKVYVSCIFSWNKNLCRQWEGIAEIGGSGYDITKTLSKQIEDVKPHINWGFTTRGCIRNCSFCIVPQKEGKIRDVGDLLDLWDGKAKQITLLDNNILGLPNHFDLICKQARDNKIKVDFNQGLDHRLLTDDICKTLKKTSHTEYRFAFDHPSYEKTVTKAIDMLRKHGINRCMWYVLVGFNTTFDEDLSRLNFLRDRNQNVYVQRYNQCVLPEYIPLARWGNQRHIFQGMTWEQFLARPENKRYAMQGKKDGRKRKNNEL